MPLNGARSVAVVDGVLRPRRAADWAEASDASSAATLGGRAAGVLGELALAAATCGLRPRRAGRSATVASIVASTSPLTHLVPDVDRDPVTVPEEEKDRSSSRFGVIVPVADTVVL